MCMTAADRYCIFLVASLAGTACARAQQLAGSELAAPAALAPQFRAIAPAPGLALPPASQLAGASAAWQLQVAPKPQGAKVQPQEVWPRLETVIEPHGSGRPAHRLELMRFGKDSSVLLTRKRTVTQIVWRVLLH
jgi:hypothetical protein